jgi:glucosamine-6-phosphate deaminase
VGLYRELVRMHKEEGLDFSKVITFNLDEYLDLPPSHKQSYRYFMDQHLFNRISQMECS